EQSLSTAETAATAEQSLSAAEAAATAEQSLSAAEAAAKAEQSLSAAEAAATAEQSLSAAEAADKAEQSLSSEDVASAPCPSDNAESVVVSSDSSEDNADSSTSLDDVDVASSIAESSEVEEEKYGEEGKEGKEGKEEEKRGEGAAPVARERKIKKKSKDVPVIDDLSFKDIVKFLQHNRIFNPTNLIDKHKELLVKTDRYKSAKHKLKRKLHNKDKLINHLEDEIAGQKETFKNLVAEKKQLVDDCQNYMVNEIALQKKATVALSEVEPLRRKVDEQESVIEDLNARLEKTSKELERFKKLIQENDNFDENSLAYRETAENFAALENEFMEQAQIDAQTISALQHQLHEAKRVNFELSKTLSSSTYWEYPENLFDVVEAAKNLFSHRLVFHERVKQTIAKFSEGESEKKPRFIQEAIKLLKSLAGPMYNMKFDPNESFSEENFLTRTGIQFAMTEKKGTKRDTAFDGFRTTTWNGKKIQFYPHLKSSVQGVEFRIYFQFLEDERKILICHVGEHLPTPATRKM
ncbi:MAG: hypothetical protein LBJ64_08220, partial [Deltaproteobacteria bacterium]|nr:hypothetical protein [Deltaproteobacteria bacterium]